MVAELGVEDGLSVKDVEGAGDRTNEGMTVAVLSRRLALAFLATTECWDTQQIYIATRNTGAIFLHVLLRIIVNLLFVYYESHVCKYVFKGIVSKDALWDRSKTN